MHDKEEDFCLEPANLLLETYRHDRPVTPQMALQLFPYPNPFFWQREATD